MYIKNALRYTLQFPVVLNDITYASFDQLRAFPHVMATHGIMEIPDPIPSYDPDESILNEIDHAPYYVLTPRDPEQVAATKLARATESRRVAYLNEADPLFFKEQRAEVPEGTWLAKVAEIKVRYPK